MKVKFNKWNNALCVGITQRGNVIRTERYVDNNSTVEEEKCNFKCKFNCLTVYIIYMHTVNKQMDNETEWFSAISM